MALLFVDDKIAREEAVSRLLWLLSTQYSNKEYLPRLNNINDKSLSYVCQIKRLYDFNKTRSTNNLYQSNSLHQLLDLLQSSNVEPVVRRSALTQMSVILEDPSMHTTFLQNNGIEVIITSMQMALNENDYREYPDSLISSISILKAICLYSSNVRQELNLNLEVHRLILRALFLFSMEDKVKEDGSVLLFLILYANVIFGSPSKGDLSIPKLLINKLNVPFKANVHWIISKNTLDDLKAPLLSNKWGLNSIQIHFSIEWFGGLNNLLQWPDVKSANDADFDDTLLLTSVDLLFLKHSCLKYCIQQQLKDIQNSTSVEDIKHAIDYLQAYILLYKVANDNFKESFDLLEFHWEEVFSVLLTSTLPGEDVTLLTYVLKFLNVLLPLYKYGENDNWLSKLLKNPTCSLYQLLQCEEASDHYKNLHKEILSLVTKCAVTEQNHLHFQVSGSKSNIGSSWNFLVDIITEKLLLNDAQHFYNLGKSKTQIFIAYTYHDM